MFELMVEPVQREFSVGCRVHVREGVRDPDFPKSSIARWRGTIVDVQPRLSLYLVQWDWETLRSVEPIHRDECAREDIAVNAMWLARNDLIFDGA